MKDVEEAHVIEVVETEIEETEADLQGEKVAVVATKVDQISTPKTKFMSPDSAEEPPSESCRKHLKSLEGLTRLISKKVEALDLL